MCGVGVGFGLASFFLTSGEGFFDNRSMHARHAWVGAVCISYHIISGHFSWRRVSDQLDPALLVRP